MLEAYRHESSSFVTLTYAEEDYPCDGCVSLRDAQLFLKNVRYRMAMLEPPMRLRYFIVGEYGDAGGRAHYHAVLFGLPQVHIGGMKKGSCDCVVCASWQKGMVYIGSVTPASAGYVVSYVLKSRQTVQAQREDGRTPEFARMSLKPGIGATALPVLEAALVDKATGEIRQVDGDVPFSIRAEQKKWPLGRYLRGKLRERLGGSVEGSRLRNVAARLSEGRVARELKREHSANVADARLSLIRTRRIKR